MHFVEAPRVKIARCSVVAWVARHRQRRPIWHCGFSGHVRARSVASHALLHRLCGWLTLSRLRTRSALTISPSKSACQPCHLSLTKLRTRGLSGDTARILQISSEGFAITVSSSAAYRGGDRDDLALACAVLEVQRMLEESQVEHSGSTCGICRVSRLLVRRSGAGRSGSGWTALGTPPHDRSST